VAAYKDPLIGRRISKKARKVWAASRFAKTGKRLGSSFKTTSWTRRRYTKCPETYPRKTRAAKLLAQPADLPDWIREQSVRLLLGQLGTAITGPTNAITGMSGKLSQEK